MKRRLEFSRLESSSDDEECQGWELERQAGLQDTGAEATSAKVQSKKSGNKSPLKVQKVERKTYARSDKVPSKKSDGCKEAEGKKKINQPMRKAAARKRSWLESSEGEEEPLLDSKKLLAGGGEEEPLLDSKELLAGGGEEEQDDKEAGVGGGWKGATLKDQTKLSAALHYLSSTTSSALATSVKKARDPQAPRRPLTSYLVFTKEQRAEVVAGMPHLGPKEVLRELGRRWVELTEAERKPYCDKASQLKEEYEKAVQSYAGQRGAE